jgi:hypothetical protein
MTYADVLGKNVDNVEAEDLFPEALLASFVAEYGEDNVLSEKSRHSQLGRWHYGFNGSGKEYLPEFLRAHASKDDLEAWIRLLGLIRTRFGLADVAADRPERSIQEDGVVVVEPDLNTPNPVPGSDVAEGNQVIDVPPEDSAVNLTETDPSEVHIREVLDMCGSTHTRSLLERFLSEVRDWPEVRTWAGTGEHLQWRNIHFNRERSKFGAFCRMHPRLERVRFRLDGTESGDLQFAQALDRKDPYRVLVVVTSEGALQEALRLARAAYESVI